MNLAVRGIEGDIHWNNEGSFHKDELRDERFDFILANPPFNISDWGGDRLKEDVRWSFGVPSPSNANYAWLQHIVHHLKPTGSAGVVLANGSMTSDQNNEDVIRKALVEADIVDCMVALPGQLFYSTQIPACLWFLTKDKKHKKWRNRTGEVLFIDARNMGFLVDRVRRELTAEDIAKIAATYHAWRGEASTEKYEDIAGYCASVKLTDIAKNNYRLAVGGFVGAEEVEDNDEDFETKMQELTAKLATQMRNGAVLDALILKNLQGLGYDN
jgi:type I restriction enzyme M protein